MTGVTHESCKSYEEMVTRLESLASIALPPITKGPSVFFASLDDWLMHNSAASAKWTIVLPDPSLNLSLPYPEDELTLVANCRNPDALIKSRFRLRDDILSSPVTALSGGERMLISLLKGILLAETTRQLLVASPFFWLDEHHRGQVRLILQDCANRGIKTTLLTIQGEDDDAYHGEKSTDGITPQDWHLAINGASVTFPAARFPRETQEKTITFCPHQGSFALKSPTLFSGANGVGKTTLSKLLAGLIQPTGRLPEVTVGGFTGNARLLMQDSVLQLFAATPASHLNRVFAHDEDQKKSARALFESMQSGCAGYLCANDATQNVGDRTTPCTILQAKLALAAERLVAGAPLLIMDEPGWCLSRLATQGFVREVTRAAHSCKTAVAIISHERHWWRGLMSDELFFSHSTVKDSVTISKGSVS